MFGKKGWFQSRRATTAVPQGERVYVVGDIHGRFDLLERLQDLIEGDLSANPSPVVRLIYLGDYIDRGPNSCEVLDRLAEETADFVNVTLLRGNHEEILLRFLADPSVGPTWRLLGGMETLLSYGIDVSKVLKQRGYPGLSECLNEKLPPHHRTVLAQLKNCATVGDFFFCHAGVRPGVPLDEQRQQDLTWIRDAFLDATEDFGKIVVHGHSPTEQPDFRPNRINIDTAAYATGRLTCLVLEGSTRRILST